MFSLNHEVFLLILHAIRDNFYKMNANNFFRNRKWYGRANNFLLVSPIIFASIGCI